MQKINSDREISGLKSDAEELKSTVIELQGKLGDISNLSEKGTEIENKTPTVEDEKFTVPSIYTGTLKNATPDATYDFELYDDFCYMYIKEGTPYISWRLDESAKKSNDNAETMANYFKVTLSKEDQKITGFNKKVVDIYIGYFGQDIEGITYIFQMDDGTLEYSTLENMIKNVSTQGKIKQINNIIKLQRVSVAINEGGGYSSVIAIDKDNNCYDLSKYIHN